MIGRQVVRTVAPLRWMHKTGKSDAWRKIPMFTSKENLKIKNFLPGFFPALGLFVIYVGIDKATASSSAAH